MVEFYDMINKFVEEDRCPSHSMPVFLDEAQDLSPSSMGSVFDYIKSKCKKSIYGG
jgi:hypothetical protein